jgi:hemolysin activation/secretion protein
VTSLFHSYAVRTSVLVLAFIPFWLAHTAYAQAPPLAPEDIGRERERPGFERLPPPEYQVPEQVPSLKLPPAPAPREEKRLSGAPQVYVRKFRITGVTVFTEGDLAAITAPYEDRKITSEELQELRKKLTLHYVNKGYINSGAVIPDQEVTDNIIEIQVIEGHLTWIEIHGDPWLRPGYVRQRIALDTGPPLNIKRLQDRLLILQQNPLIERLDAELGPGAAPGEGLLKVEVEEARPYEVGIGYDNHRSPSIGAERFQIWGALHNLTGWGDELEVQYGLTEGLDDISVSYTAPFTVYDTSLSLWFQRSDAAIVEDPFSQLDTESESETYGIELRQPFYFTPYHTLAATFSFERRNSLTTLFGEPFPFSLGVPVAGDDVGESDVAPLRFGLDWLHRSQDQVIAARTTFSFGLDVLGATSNEPDANGRFANCPFSDICPDGQFFAWLGQFQWARRLRFWESELLFRTDLQIAGDPLLPLEKFSVGGARSVRGYRENQFVRDNGWSSSLEWRVPVFRLPIPYLTTRSDEGTVQIAPFFDIGRSWDTDTDTVEAEMLYSIGLGVRWDPTRNIHAELYWGEALTPVENPSDDLQDAGIHFQVLARLF